MDLPVRGTADGISTNVRRFLTTLIGSDVLRPRQNKQAGNIFWLNFRFKCCKCVFVSEKVPRLRDKNKSAENVKILFIEWI